MPATARSMVGSSRVTARGSNHRHRQNPGIGGSQRHHVVVAGHGIDLNGAHAHGQGAIDPVLGHGGAESGVSDFDRAGRIAAGDSEGINNHATNNPMR